MYGLTRGTFTLIGAAAAGLLLWVASQADGDSNGGYWAFVGLVAAAGLTMAISQLLGGWTKWGWPRVSGKVFLLGFLPALVAGGLVLLAGQPDGGTGSGWAGGLGLDDLADDLTAVTPAIAFGLGLVFGLTFDTTGPRTREVVHEDARRPGYAGPVPIETQTAADEPVAAERATVADEDYREPDREFVTTLGADGGTPVAPQPDPDAPAHTDRPHAS